MRTTMSAMQWLRRLASRVGETASRSHRSTGCADCPIVASCGLEPQKHCLPRLEAIAAGKRRRVEPADTLICDIPR